MSRDLTRDLVHTESCRPPYSQHKSNMRSVHFELPPLFYFLNCNRAPQHIQDLFKRKVPPSFCPRVAIIIKMSVLHYYNFNKLRRKSVDLPVCVQTFGQCARRPVAAAVVRGERVDFIFSHITSVLPGQDSGSF